MGKRGVIKIIVIIFTTIFLFILISETITTLSPDTNIPFAPKIISSLKPVLGQGGASVPITTIELTDEKSYYDIKPGRLKFEFGGKVYAIQVRRVKQDYVDFLVMVLDMDKPEDITAYTIDNSFILKPNEKKEIDLDKDGASDVYIELNGIISAGEHGSIRSADFSIKGIGENF